MAPNKRAWVLPILRTLDEMGGSGSPKDVIAKVLDLFTSTLSAEQVAQVRDHARLGWIRLEMVRSGLLGGDRKTWHLTSLSRLYLHSHRNDLLALPRPFSLPGDDADEAVVAIVSVTETRAYELPILAVVRKGRVARKEIISRVCNHLRDRLLPGDTRIMPNTESTVANYRSNWAISNLWREGCLKNPARGYWEITEKGLERLEAEEAFFSIGQFQSSSRATVVNSSGVRAKERFDASNNLTTLRSILGGQLFEDINNHLQLSHGPSPIDPHALTRNLILYGPAGTGKTRLAKLLAQALTEEERPGTDSRWRLIAFHPSYTYQDFVQGMRPNLETTSLNYRIVSGPFLEICAHAEAEPDRYFVLVIDEINRGEPARIFGELLYALEYRGEEIQLSTESSLRVPTNLIVVGTMNSSDRSSAMSDHALRRRFGFCRIDPDPDVIAELLVGNADLMAGTLEAFNQWLETKLDREHTLGHSYFLNPCYHPFTAPTIERIWRLNVLPLMEEYFCGRTEDLKEARGAWKKAITTAAAKMAKGNH